MPRIISQPQGHGAVGVPYHYDADDRPSAQGDRPLFWKLGKLVAGQQLNIPAGMIIDHLTGAITWTPTPAQAGDSAVTLVVTDGVDTAQQEFTVTVAAPAQKAVPPGGCRCSSGAAAGWLVLVGLWVSRLRRRLR